MMDEAMFVDTAGMSTSDAKYMCGMSYEKNKMMLMEGEGELTDKQKKMPDGLKVGILKRYEKDGTLSEKGKKTVRKFSWSYGNESGTHSSFCGKNPLQIQGEITPKLAEEGLKIDEELKKKNVEEALKNPGLQSPTFTPTNE